MSVNGWVILGLVLWAAVETMREVGMEPGRSIVMMAATVLLLIAFAKHIGLVL